ncbi:30S ribosomal protein S18, partial [Chloroflexota bacterium]
MPVARRFTGRKRERGKGRYIPRRKVCSFCVSKADSIDYKNVGLLRRFISDLGKIEPRRKTGVCPKHQRTLSVALKRARHLALLPYTVEHLRQSGGPRSMGRPERPRYPLPAGPVEATKPAEAAAPTEAAEEAEVTEPVAEAAE